VYHNDARSVFEHDTLFCHESPLFTCPPCDAYVDIIGIDDDTGRGESIAASARLAVEIAALTESSLPRGQGDTPLHETSSGASEKVRSPPELHTSWSGAIPAADICGPPTRTTPTPRISADCTGIPRQYLKTTYPTSTKCRRSRAGLDPRISDVGQTPPSDFVGQRDLNSAVRFGILMGQKSYDTNELLLR
jgi:hypothetical protein